MPERMELGPEPKEFGLERERKWQPDFRFGWMKGGRTTVPARSGTI